MTRDRDVPIERLLALTFIDGRLQGGGSVLHVPGIDGTGWWFAFPRESHGAAPTLAVAPTEDDVRAFVSEREGVQAFSEGTGWLGSRRPPCCRVDLGAGTWVVCFGTDAPPDWLRKLAAASDPELVARMLAAAGLSLGWRELAGTGKQAARRWSRVRGERPPIVASDLEGQRRLALARPGWLSGRSRATAVWTAAGVFVVASLLLLAAWRLARWPFARDGRQEPRLLMDHSGGLAAARPKPARPAPQIVVQAPDPCAVLKTSRPLTSRFCAAVAARGGADDPAFEDRLRSLQTRACGGKSTCVAPLWDAGMIASLEDLYSRLLLRRFAGEIAVRLDTKDPYRGAIKPIAATADRSRQAIAQAVASDPDWHELWRNAHAPEPQELAREAIASLPFARPSQPPRRK